MKSVTLLFPGQGSQYVGMGNNLYKYKAAKEIFTLADSALNFSITDIMQDGPAEKLALTEYTQPAIVTHSIALFEQLKIELEQMNIKIDRVLGHSVGEYSALIAAGSLSFTDGIKAVHKRGKYMQEACPSGLGTMYAVLRVPFDMVTKACEAVSTGTEKVMCANYNDPTQVVISGHASAAKKAVQWLSENYTGKQMAKELNVSAPFHSSLMKKAELNLTSYLNGISIKENTIPYIANINAKELSISGDEIKQNLITQVCGSVLWQQSIANLADETLCIEVGPGKVLSGLNKRINNTLKCYTLDSSESFEGLSEFLK